MMVASMFSTDAALSMLQKLGLMTRCSWGKEGGHPWAWAGAGQSTNHNAAAAGPAPVCCH